MVSCSIITCKNVSTKSYHNNKTLTFHRFPKDPDIRDKWVATTGRKDWTPGENDRICSEHFKEEEFVIASERRILMKTGVPTLKICTVNSTDNTSSTSLPLATKLPPAVSVKRVYPNLTSKKETADTLSDDSDAIASEEEWEDSSPPLTPSKRNKGLSSNPNFEKKVIKYLKDINKKVDQDECTLYTKLLYKRLQSLKEGTREKAMVEIDRYVHSLKQQDDGIATVHQLPQINAQNDPQLKAKCENEGNGET